MAIYHLEAKVITRSVGRSAVAASAYMSCSAIYNDYDGIQHDYTRKQGLVYEQIFLPTNAPPEWNDRSILWNAVEEAEKTKDSRLAREFVVALPTELNCDEWIELLTEYVKENFVNDGMCADVCIHDTDGHNPHAHIMLTVRPLDENGKWQNKTQKEYLCVKNGEEKGLTADEFKTAKADGWEKQYPYMVGKKKEYMPPSVAEAKGYTRADKHPKSTRYGRQNPISERWNSDEQLLIWRKNWADVNNKYLERNNIAERIDYRSNAERGIDEQPTIHEGVTARIMEQRGFVSDRCEINRQIKADNKLLRELKAQVKKLLEAVKNTIPYIAETLETMRKSLIHSLYNITKIRRTRHTAMQRVDLTTTDLNIHKNIVNELKEKVSQRKTLQEKKQTIPAIKFIQHKELSTQIAELTEEIEEIKSRKEMILDDLNCKNDTDVKAIKKALAETKKAIPILKEQEDKYIDIFNSDVLEFREVKKQYVTEDFDEMQLIDARLEYRDVLTQEFYKEVDKESSKDRDDWAANEAVQEVDKYIGENLYHERYSIKEKLDRIRREQRQKQGRPTYKLKRNKQREDEWER